MINVSDRVSVADKQLRGNQSIMYDGQVLAVEGSSARVIIDGEEVPRTFPLDQLKSSSDVYGHQSNPNDNQVINAMRR